MAETVLAADGTPLKRSLSRALRRQKLRALGLIAPLLFFVLITFIVPIASMLFRSVENEIVGNTLPYTVEALAEWDADQSDIPSEATFQAMFFDMFLAAEAKRHTRLGTRLNYETTGLSSLFRQSGRQLGDVADISYEPLTDLDKAWDDGETWYALMNARDATDTAMMAEQRKRIAKLTDKEASGTVNFAPDAEVAALLPLAAREYTAWAIYVATQDGRDPAARDPWEAMAPALLIDLKTADISGYSGPIADMLRAAQDTDLPVADFTAAFTEMGEGWGTKVPWETIQTNSSKYTSGYFLNAVDARKTAEGVAWQPDNKQILIKLFGRTIWMSVLIMFSCIALGYPIAWLLANLPRRQANLLLILVLLPFWTSLLVRTSAWKVMLQQQGVINDVLVWIGLVADDNRLIIINNQFGTIISMTHILLPFMILPMYSVMQTIQPTYLRAAKSLGATNWTAFWRVYFPQSIPGIGAGSILVFILAIGYYITPEIVGGTKGVFISNRIAYNISSSLNWGLAAALGSILLAAVLVLYWAYDKIVGIDNVKLG